MSDTSLTRTLSEQESYLLSTLAAQGRTLFTIADARAVLDVPDANLHKLLHRLYRKQWVERLERGRYLLLPLAAGPEPHWTEHEYLIAAALMQSDPYWNQAARLRDRVTVAGGSLLRNGKEITCPFCTVAEVESVRYHVQSFNLLTR